MLQQISGFGNTGYQQISHFSVIFFLCILRDVFREKFPVPENDDSSCNRFRIML